MLKAPPLAVSVDEIGLVTENAVNMIFRFNILFYRLHIFVDYIFLFYVLIDQGLIRTFLYLV